MTLSRRRKGRPYDPSKAHDRRSTDLLRNAQVAPIEVDDPLELGGKLIVMRSTRDDPLGGFHARHFIDDAQYAAGRAFQNDFETAERGPRAIDPGKEFVDGGALPEPITESQRKAAIRLAGAYRLLGQNGAALINAVLVDRLGLDKICENRGLVGEREKVYVGKRFRECLDDLATHYGFAMKN